MGLSNAAALALYRRFTHEVIANLPQDAFRLCGAVVLGWLSDFVRRPRYAVPIRTPEQRAAQAQRATVRLRAMAREREQHPELWRHN